MKIALILALVVVLVLAAMWVTYRWSLHRSEVAREREQMQHEREMQLEETLFDDDSIDRELERERNR